MRTQIDLPIHELGNFDPLFFFFWWVFLGGEGSQMQLIGDFYTSLGVKQIFHKIRAIIILPSLLL
jgi:hypothetical protein